MHDSTSWLLLSHSSHINKAPTPMILPPVYHLNSSMTFQYHQHLKSGHHLLFLYQLSRSSPWLQTCSHQQAIKILVQTLPVFHYFLRFYLFTFRKRRREWENEGEKHQCVVASHVPPTGDLVHNPGMCPNWELNRWPFGSQANTQSTEPYQPGLYLYFKHVNFIK